MRHEKSRGVPRRFGARSVAAAIVAVSCLAPLPAQAWFLGERMSSSDIAFALSDAGYRMTGRPQRSGRHYVVDGVGSDGRTVRVLVDAYAGVVVGVKAAPQQPSQPRTLFGGLFSPEPRMVPPRNVPNVPAFRPFQPADRPSSQQSAGQPSFQQPADPLSPRQPGGQAALQQPADQPAFPAGQLSPQQPADPAAQDRREANVRPDGDAVRPAIRSVPDRQRAAPQKAPRKTVNQKGAVERPTGTAALQERSQDPAKPAEQSRAEKSTASINGADRKPAESGGMVAPVLLDEVKPKRVNEPPPMPQVVPLE
jgi:hypothetical protein